MPGRRSASAKPYSADRDADRQHELGRQHVRAVPEADAADQDQHREPAERAAVQLAAGERGREEHERERHAGDDARGVVHARAAARTRRSRARRRRRRAAGAAGTARRRASAPRSRRLPAISDATPMDVASSVFHGSWPTRPSATHAAHSSTSPNCFSARYGPAGLTVSGSTSSGGYGRGGCMLRSRKRRGCRNLSQIGSRSLFRDRFRTPGKKKAAEGCLFRRDRGVRSGRLGRAALGRSAGGTCRCGRRCPSPSACPCRTGGTASRLRCAAACRRSSASRTCCRSCR